MVSKQLKLNSGDVDCYIETFRSYNSFSQIFEDAVRLHCITYCDSPDLILELFEEFHLQQMEVIVGKNEDYRESLTGHPDVVDKLERLRRSESLRIFTCPNWTVHSKLYEIEHSTGSLTLLCGSQNLTRAGWGNQTNTAVVFETSPDSDVHEAFRKEYEFQREKYGVEFLKDLSEEIDAAEDDDRRDIISRWVEGRITTLGENEEFFGGISDEIVENAPDPSEETLVNTKQIDRLDREEKQENIQSAPKSEGETSSGPIESQPEGSEIVQSLRNYDDKFRSDISTQFKNYGVVSGDYLRISPRAYSQQTETLYGLPIMRILQDEGIVHLNTQNGMGYFGSSPPSDTAKLNDVLDHLEAYFETVDVHANTNNREGFKMHLFEGLLYLLWAPFIDLHAKVYREAGVRNLDKRLPFLYIYGHSNSGKGTFAEFALTLLSGGQVTAPLDADEFGKRLVRQVRNLKTSFPLVVDDIPKQTIGRTDTLRNFWSGWSSDHIFPALIFISNDAKPDEWFRNRAKILHFDGRFDKGVEGELEVNRIIDQGSPLFHWFTYLYLSREIVPRDDILYDARETILELYSLANRPVPSYFPESPAEEEYDVGQRTWRRAFDDGKFTIEKDRNVLRIVFADDMEHWEVGRLQNELPSISTSQSR